MQNIVIAFLAGMAVMYCWSAIRWKRVGKRLGKWLQQHWQGFQKRFTRRKRRSSRLKPER